MSVKQTRREEILEAMLELVVERGINDAPMSELAKRSGASAGIIYHYFANKDDIINQLYLSIIAIKGKSLTENLLADMPTKVAFASLEKCLRFLPQASERSQVSCSVREFALLHPAPYACFYNGRSQIFSSC
jgi:AcrR family transcriptional regulator